MTYTDEEATRAALAIPDDAWRRDAGEQWVAKWKGEPIYANNEVYYSSESKVKTALRANYYLVYHGGVMFQDEKAARGEPRGSWYDYHSKENKHKVLNKLIELGIITIERIR